MIFFLAVLPIGPWAMLCAGPLILAGAAGVITAGLPSGWQSLGTPPETVSAIVAVQRSGEIIKRDEVFVKTATGKVFVCCRWGTGWQETNWPNILARPAYFGHLLEPYSLQKYPELAGLPAKVKDYTDSTWSWEWLAVATRVVLLEDNSVWWWQINASRDAFVLLALAAGGTVAYYWVLGRKLKAGRSSALPASTSD